jgi:hypothetical protein
MKKKKNKNDIDQYGEPNRQWKLDRNEKKIKRKQKKGFFFSNDVKDLLDDAIDNNEKEAKYNDPIKVSSIEFNSAFNESYEYLDNLSGETTDTQNENTDSDETVSTDSIGENEIMTEFKVSSKEDFKGLFYFLKLKNGGKNTCYANSSIQMLISCGEAFFNTIKENCKAGFCENFRILIAHFKSKNDQVVSSLSLRKAANVNNPNIQDSYIDGSQQDTFGFLLDILNISCGSVVENFKINYSENNKCINCSTNFNFKKLNQSFYISLSRIMMLKESF